MGVSHTQDDTTIINNTALPSVTGIFGVLLEPKEA